jgi:hypothetical protein
MSLEVVQRARAKYAYLPAGPERAHRIVNEVGWELRNDGAGLLYKPAGTNYNERSLDVIIYKPGGETYDILIDAEGAAKPAWGRTKPTGFGDVSKWRAAVPPIGVEPEPGEPPSTGEPPPTGDYITRAEFEAYQRTVDNHFALLQQRIDQLAARVTTVEAKPTPQYMLVGDPDAPAIGTSTAVLHTHQLRAAVVLKT